MEFELGIVQSLTEERESQRSTKLRFGGSTGRDWRGILYCGDWTLKASWDVHGMMDGREGVGSNDWLRFCHIR